MDQMLGRTMNSAFKGRLLAGLVVGAAFLVAGLALPLAAPGESSPGARVVSEPTRSYIVVLEDSVEHPGRVAQRHAVNRDADLSHVYKTAIEGYSAEMTPADKAMVEEDPNVAYVSLDGVLHASAQTTPTGVKRIFGTSNPTLDIDEQDDVQVNVDVAVIDTGVDPDHPDLRVVERTNCLGQPGNLCVNNSGDDAFGHGTHVAGIIGAVDNGTGVVGVAPGARIWSVKAGDQNGAFPMSDVVAAVDWVTARAGQIEVVNMSLGCIKGGACAEQEVPLEEAISASIGAGVVYVVSAGNNNVNVSGGPYRNSSGTVMGPPNYPADFSNVITVSAISDYDGAPGSSTGFPTCSHKNWELKAKINGVYKSYFDQDDTLANYSNWGPQVDIAAPGSCILSTFKHGGYKVMSGTSMSAPHVTGAAAILASKSNPSNFGDVQAIKATLLDRGNYGWTDTHWSLTEDLTDYEWLSDAPALKEPLLDISNSGVFNVSSPGSVGSVGVVSHVAGSMDLFARAGNNEIWHKVYHPAPTQWGSWYTEPLPNGVPIAGAPAAGARSSLSRDLFVKGNDNELYFRNFYSGQGWSPWFWIPAPHGGKILNSPAVTDRPDRTNGLDVVVRSDNGLVYFKEYTDPTGWSEWQGMGAPPPGASSSPATAVHLGKYWHIMVRGNDGAIWDRAWGEGMGWTDWISLGGVATSAPALTATESGNDLYLFVRGTDNAIWMRRGFPGGWTPWESLGGSWVSDPAATSMSSAGVSVFAAGLDNKIQERRLLYGGWTNWMRIDDDCPPGGCTWNPGGPGTVKSHSVENNDLVAVDSSGTANVFGGWEGGIDLSEPVKSLAGQLDSALLDGKGHYVVDVADVDDDGNSDLITVKDDGKVLVHLGQEDRAFATALDTGISLPLALNGKGQNEPIAVADVTGDGFDDLVAFNATGSGAFAVYKGQLNGKFATTAVQSTENTGSSALLDGTGQYFVDVADATGDGLADLVTTNTNGYAYIYKGNADGKLGPYSIATQINSIMNDGVGQEPVGLGDVTGDGRADLLTLDGTALKLWAGKSDATFAASTAPYAGTVDSSLMDGVGEALVGLLDHDGDGLSDLVSTKAQGGLQTYKATAEAKFSAPVAHEPSLTSTRHLENGFEFALQKPWIGRKGCTEGGCAWMGVSERVAPAALATASSIDLYARSKGGLLYQRASTASNWSQLGGQPITSAPVAVPHAGATNVYARGVDGLLYQKARTSEGWSSWFSLGGPGGQPITAAPAAVSHAGTVEVYVRAGNGMLNQKWCCSGPGGWSAWSQMTGPLGGAITAAPAAVSHAGIVEIFVRGVDGLLYQRPAGAEGWWTQVGGPNGQPITSAPAAVSHAGELNVYVRGNDGFLHQKSRGSEGWSSWWPMGGPGGEPIVAKPAATVASDGSVHVYVRGADGAIHERWCCSGPEGWSSWQSLGQDDPPAADSDVDGDGRADLVTLRADGVAYVHRGGADAKFGTGVSSFASKPLNPAQYDGIGHHVVDVADVAGFMGEKRADLITLTDNGDVHVYPGKADASFQEQAKVSELDLSPGLLQPGGDEPIAAADVDGDRHADLVVHEAATARVSVYRGKPDGSFGPSAIVARSGIASALHTGMGHYFVDVADVTGDGRGDLVSMNGGDLVVFAGQSNGTFGSPTISQADAIDPAMDDGTGYEPVGLGDVTGDGKADLALLKAGTLYLYPGSSAATFGAPAASFGGAATSTTFGPGFVEMLGLMDVDGNGNADVAGIISSTSKARVVLGQASGVFATPATSEGTFPTTQHEANQSSSGNELALEKPAWRRRGCDPAGCDQAGADTIGMFRPGDKAWYLRNSNSAGVTDVSFGYSFEPPAELPLSGDWNGDGIDTIGIYRPGTGQFLLRNSNFAGPADHSFTYTSTNPAEIPLSGDWNGDGIDTIGLYIPVVGEFYEGEGMFHLRNSNSAGASNHSFAYNYANVHEIPLTGDWNGDGIDTIGLYQPVVGSWNEGEGMFHLRNANSSGATHHSFAYNWANPAEIPVVGDWDGDGDDTIGQFQPGDGKWHLRNANSSGATDYSFAYSWGAPADLPVTGDWDGS